MPCVCVLCVCCVLRVLFVLCFVMVLFLLLMLWFCGWCVVCLAPQLRLRCCTDMAAPSPVRPLHHAAPILPPFVAAI